MKVMKCNPLSKEKAEGYLDGDFVLASFWREGSNSKVHRRGAKGAERDDFYVCR
jgi:hypothetical protein